MFLEGEGCVLECPGDYFNKNDEECIPCVENCMDCESETCEQCEKGYFLHHKDGKCYDELEGYYSDEKD